MPQVDLVSVCSGHERTVTCETLADDDLPTTTSTTTTDQIVQSDPIPVPDYAPESFWLSKDAELDWLSENAFIERKGSGKGAPHSTNFNPNSNIISVSQRYSVNLKSKASILGLPKTQKTTYAESKLRRNCRPPSIRFFPKRCETSTGKSAVTVTEPTSPKVSCIGRVRSKKDRSRRMRNRQKQPEPEIRRSRSAKKTKTGFWTNFRSMFRAKGHKPAEKIGDELPLEETVIVKNKGSLKKKREFNARPSESLTTTPVEPPSLGGVKRFQSGRRSDAWAADIEVDGAKSESLDRGSIWESRINAGQLHGIHVSRCASVGPVSG
ncbi:hypothetical protein Ancab_014306 [Ancistrocladus abbreviatus]